MGLIVEINGLEHDIEDIIEIIASSSEDNKIKMDRLHECISFLEAEISPDIINYEELGKVIVKML